MYNYFESRAARKNYYSNYGEGYYAKNGNFTNSIYDLLRLTTAEKRSLISQTYLKQIENDLQDMRKAKNSLMYSLADYNTKLDDMIRTQVTAVHGKTVSLGDLVGGITDINYQGKLQAKIDKYQQAMAKGQHTMNSILQTLTNGEMRYNIAVAGSGGKFSKGAEFSLDLNSVFKLETAKFDTTGKINEKNGKSIFDLVVNKSSLESLLDLNRKRNYNLKFNISQQTRKDLTNKQFTTVLNTIVNSQPQNTVLEEMTRSYARSIDANMWEAQQNLGLSPGDAYERYIAQRYNIQYYLGGKWSHSSYTAAAGGDINFYDTANKFYMIQAKTFNQSKRINERYNDISSHSYFDYKYGFQNLTNLGNIENALFAYQNRLQMYASRDFEDMSFMDNVKRIRVEESMWAALTNEGRREIAKSFSEKGSKSFSSSWEEDAGLMEI